MMITLLQFFSAGLPQNGDDDEGFDGYILEDVLKEARRAVNIVRFPYISLH